VNSQQSRVRGARPADDAVLADLEIAAWSAESGFPSSPAKGSCSRSSASTAATSTTSSWRNTSVC